MAKIPLPERGQPLDVSYLYQIANALNDLSSQVSPATYKYLTVDTQSVGKQSIKISESRMIGGYVEVANKSTKNSGDEVEFSYSFQSDFKYPPVVTATPVNFGNTTAGRNISIVLTSVTTSGVTGWVKFNSNGEVSIGVNLIIIGIPN